MNKVIVIVLTLTAFVIAQDFEYVGSAKCKMCHNKEEKGAQYTKWLEGPHSGAFETLKNEQSAQIVADMGIEGDAWKAPECLKCHATGFGDGGYEVKCDDFWNPAEDDKAGAKAVKRMKALEGVGCESCHGPGSEYKSSKVKKALVAGEITAESIGLWEQNEALCVTCHNEESPTYKPFDYEARSAEIAHPRP
jgi:hypothetical protein